MTLSLRYAARSDVGLVRSANEDSGFAGRRLLAVADGMGGHAAGELASSTAIATLAELDSEELGPEELLTELQQAIEVSAERIAQFIEADPSRAGMGTTLTAILWGDGRIAIVHVGDSRAYLLRDGELQQITTDHTYVQSLIDAGRITPDEARRHPKRNLLLRAIDGSGLPEGDPSLRQAESGDRYLLCTDGLSGVVPDDAIARVLLEVPDPTAAVSMLVELALEAGAPDNVTAVVADVLDADTEEVAREATLMSAVVVGAAGEPRNRAALPGLQFPDDATPLGDGADAILPGGPAVAGGLATRSRGALGADPSDEAGEDATAHGSGARPAPPVTTLDPDGLGAPPTPPGFVRRHAPWLAAGALLVVGLLVGALGFLWWLSSQWYVGSQTGYVAVFQGVPQSLAGLPLSRTTSQTALPLAVLPYYDQQQVERTIDAATEAEAQRIVTDLEAKAAACAADPPPLGCPTPTGSTTGSGTGTAPPTASPTASPSAAPSPGP
jgi:protein phosphatase